MQVIIADGTPEEIAALVLAIQERRERTIVIGKDTTAERNTSSSGDVRKGVIYTGPVT